MTMTKHLMMRHFVICWSVIFFVGWPDGVAYGELHAHVLGVLFGSEGEKISAAKKQTAQTRKTFLMEGQQRPHLVVTVFSCLFWVDQPSQQSSQAAKPSSRSLPATLRY